MILMKIDRLKIFVVDDDPFFSSVLKNILEERVHCLVFTFGKIQDCIQMLHYDPSIIFLDYNFESPNKNSINGLTGLNWMKDLAPRQKIIMMSSESNADKLKKGKKIGATDFIIKNTDLSSEISIILNNHFPKFIKPAA